jgi:hypothetical protein
MRDVGDTFFVVGLWLLVVPSIIVGLVCLFPFTPRPVDQFFRYREYKMDPNKPDGTKTEETKSSEAKTPATTPQKGEFQVSDPAYVEK